MFWWNAERSLSDTEQSKKNGLAMNCSIGWTSRIAQLFLGLLTPEDEGATILQNVRNYLPNYKESHPQKLKNCYFTFSVPHSINTPSSHPFIIPINSADNEGVIKLNPNHKKPAQWKHTVYSRI